MGKLRGEHLVLGSLLTLEFSPLLSLPLPTNNTDTHTAHIHALTHTQGHTCRHTDVHTEIDMHTHTAQPVSQQHVLEFLLLPTSDGSATGHCPNHPGDKVHMTGTIMACFVGPASTRSSF